MIGDVTALSVLAGQLQYDPMVPRRERRLAFAIQQGMLRLIPLISSIESRISGGGDAQRKALSPPLAEAVGLVRDGKAPPDDFVARMNRSEEHTSELPSLMRISYAVFCLKKNTEN